MKMELKPLIDSLWHLPSAALGALFVKGWEWALRWWKQRLTEQEKLIMLCAFANHGSLDWKQEQDGAVVLPFQLMGRRQPIGRADEPPMGDYKFDEQGEIGALITKGFMEVADNGYRRRLTHEGYKRVEAIKKSLGIADANNVTMWLVLEGWWRTGEVPDRGVPWWKLWKR